MTRLVDLVAPDPPVTMRICDHESCVDVMFPLTRFGRIIEVNLDSVDDLIDAVEDAVYELEADSE